MVALGVRGSFRWREFAELAVELAVVCLSGDFGVCGGQTFCIVVVVGDVGSHDGLKTLLIWAIDLMAILVENNGYVDVVVVRIFERCFEVCELCVMYEEEER
jgi:hypothetical protein